MPDKLCFWKKSAIVAACGLLANSAACSQVTEPTPATAPDQDNGLAAGQDTLIEGRYPGIGGLAGSARDEPRLDPLKANSVGASPVIEQQEPSHFQYLSLRAALDTEHDITRRRALVASLERWRRLPHELGPRYLLVNIPEFVVRLVDHDEVASIQRVVVGKPSTPTPEFSASVTGVILNPPWVVPDSIVAESVGALVRNQPAAARAKGYAWVRSASGRRQIIQKPGPANALGQVKFDMPNPYRVYLHDTPAKHLFAEDERTFSHGCVRVEDALVLAERLLAGSIAYRARFDEILQTRKTHRIALDKPIPVHVVYLTAFADADGSIRYLADPYRLDAKVSAQSAVPERFQLTTLKAERGCLATEAAA